MSISQHLTTFAGMPVEQYNPKAKKKRRKPCLYRVAARDMIKSVYDDDAEYEFPELLDLFLSEHGGPDLTALVIGAYNYDDMCESLSDRGATDVVEALVASRKRMPN